MTDSDNAGHVRQLCILRAERASSIYGGGAAEADVLALDAALLALSPAAAGSPYTCDECGKVECCPEFHTAAQPQGVVGDEMRKELEALYRAYVRLLESGRDRIMDLGGKCDPVDVMERTDPYLIQARRALRPPTREGQ
jgi:hypothetical protein